MYHSRHILLHKNGTMLWTANRITHWKRYCSRCWSWPYSSSRLCCLSTLFSDVHHHRACWYNGQGNWLTREHSSQSRTCSCAEERTSRLGKVVDLQFGSLSPHRDSILYDGRTSRHGWHPSGRHNDVGDCLERYSVPDREPSWTL